MSGLIRLSIAALVFWVVYQVAQPMADGRHADSTPANAATPATLAASTVAAAEPASCLKGGAIVQNALQLERQRKYNAAFQALLPCAHSLEDPQVKALYVRVMTAARKEDEAKFAAEKAARKKQGVHIGMTAQEVLESNWGRPQSINRTTTARGTHEQWVYPGYRNYLYFEDGTLTAIQN